MAERSIQIKLTPEQLDELTHIALRIGFEKPEDLLRTYIREVIIATRIEQATANLRDTVTRGSTDLEDLVSERKPSSKKR